MTTDFDRQRLIRQLGSEAIVEELLVMFTQSIQQHLRELDDALATSDSAAAQRAVHNIKGISGSIYCRSLHERATTLDQQLKAGRIDAAGIEDLRTAAQRFLAEIAP